MVTVRDIETIYQVPLLLEEQGLLARLREALLLDQLSLPPSLIHKGSNLWQLWKKTVVSKPYLEPVNVALVGKYIALPDSECPPTLECRSPVGLVGSCVASMMLH